MSERVHPGPAGPGESEEGRRPPHVDASGATGVQVGSGNTQILYLYQHRQTWTDGVAQPPLVTVSGDVTSPYRGLAAFDERDAAFYFGREEAASAILERMAERCAHGDVLVVSGVSGAGKSSLLRAGVLPSLRASGLPGQPGSARWPCLIFTPSRNPLEELALQVAAIGGASAADLHRELENDPTRFALLARQAARQQVGDDLPDEMRRQARLVVFVDQFEQLFTLCPDETQRRAFVTALLHTTRGDEPGAVVVLGVRADFEARCADYPDLVEAVQSRYLVTAMTEAQLRLAITQPAERLGSTVDPALVELLLADAVAARPGEQHLGSGSATGAGVLPLISHALDLAWRTRAGETLTLADYQRTGGIEGAVATSAQRAYDSLTPAQQEEARLVFLRLIVTSTDGVDTAGRAVTAELTSGMTDARAADVHAVLDAFAGQRLLTLAAGTVEIAHEAILTAWPLLRDTWLADSHADRMVRSRLEAGVREWTEHAHDPAYLYAGSLLAAASASAERWAQDPARFPPLGAPATEFLAASHGAAHRRERRRRVLVGTLAALSLALVVATGVVLEAQHRASEQRDQAQHEATVATGRALAASAIGQVGTDLPAAMSDALASYRTYPSTEARNALWVTATASPHLVRYTPVGARVTSLAAAVDGSAYAVGDSGGRVTVLDPKGSVVRSTHVLGSPVTQLAVSHGGRVVVASDGHHVKSVRGGTVGDVAGGGPHVTSVAVSGDGGTTAVTGLRHPGAVVTVQDASGVRTRTMGAFLTFVVVGTDIVVLDPAYGGWTRLDPRSLRTIASGSAGFGAHQYAATLAPDGSAISYTNSARTVPVWSTQGAPGAGFEQATAYGREPGVAPTSMALSPGSSWMAVADSGSVYVSATRPSATGTDPYRAVLGGLSGPGVSGVAFLGGPDRLVTSSGSGVALWDLRQFQRVATRQSARVVPGCVACAGPLVATTDGSRVAFESDTFDSPVIHDLADGRELRWADSTYGPQLWDGERRLVLGFADGSVRTVDATTGQAGPAWPDPQPAAISYLRWVDDGSHVAVVDARGGLTVRDPDGTVVRRFAPPASIRNGYVASGYAAVDSHADHVAYRVTHGVMVVDTHSGRTVARVARKATAADLEFIGDRLLVSTFSADESGYDVDLYRDYGRTLARHWTLAHLLEPPVVDQALTEMAYQEQSGRIVVRRLSTGEQLASFTVPAQIEGIKSGFAFTPDGRRLVVVTEGGQSDNGHVEDWQIATGSLVGSLCAARSTCS